MRFITNRKFRVANYFGRRQNISLRGLLPAFGQAHKKMPSFKVYDKEKLIVNRRETCCIIFYFPSDNSLYAVLVGQFTKAVGDSNVIKELKFNTLNNLYSMYYVQGVTANYIAESPQRYH